ncbi:MAG: S1 family peptidase, partial [Deltaproteobacteria bacterium]
MPARTSRLQLPFAAAALFTVTLLLGPPGKSASPEDFHANIVNGRLTSGFPAAGALLLGDEATAVTWCSGVLIGCDTFLTAAHCVCDTNGADCQGARAPSPFGRLVYLQHAGFFRAT